MADLTTTISETIVLNGSVRGSSNTHTITDITNISEMILECPAGADAGATTIIGNWASVVNPTSAKYHNYDYNDTEYIRVTNLHATQSIQIAYVSTGSDSTCDTAESVDTCRFQLRAGETMVMWQTEAGKKGESSAPTWASALSNLSYIQIYNPTYGETATSVNVELFTASKK